MPKPKKFKYLVGQSVKFRFYDGSIHEGVIDSYSYRNEHVDYLPTEYDQCMYTCHSPDYSGRYTRGYMIYTVTANMIKDVLDYPVSIMPFKDYPTSKVSSKPIEIVKSNSPVKSHLGIAHTDTTTLEQAIDKQREFLKR